MTATNTLRAAALIPMIFASASALAWGIEPLRLPTAPTFVSPSFYPPPPVVKLPPLPVVPCTPVYVYNQVTGTMYVRNRCSP